MVNVPIGPPLLSVVSAVSHWREERGNQSYADHPTRTEREEVSGPVDFCGGMRIRA